MIIESRVAGVSFYQNAVKRVERENAVKLVREPDNEYDSNAIRVDVFADNKWVKVGYIPKSWNIQLIEVWNKVIIEAEVLSVGRPNEKAPIGMMIGILIKDKPHASSKRLE